MSADPDDTTTAAAAAATTDTDSAEFAMLDQLAFDCNQLAADLAGVDLSTEDQNRLLAEYIGRADSQHRAIADFADDLDWFNVTEPLSTTGALHGKLVILDFFTYCCINCLHVLPDLKRLEQLYTVADGLVVIGVHSAKFANERDSANILAAVQRYNITHPVVNDAQCAMWQALDIKCWPTMVVLGPRANPLFVLMGEGNYEQLEKYVGAAVKFYGAQQRGGVGATSSGGGLSTHALPLNPAIDLIVSGSLQFPGKVVCSRVARSGDEATGSDDEEELYAIVDTGHHRVLVVRRDGVVLHRIGGKAAGFVDGDFRAARFNGPQGVCFRTTAAGGRELYVADTENHAIRRVDLRTRIVDTVAGTGAQGDDRVGGALGCAQSLSSPWDVSMCRTRSMDVSVDRTEDRQVPEIDVLLIANAGQHQIWAMFLEETVWWKGRRYAAGTVVALAGNGNEENRNNSYPQNAAFAQPSGLALRADTKELFVADSESSAVRKVQLLDGKVAAVAGGDRNPQNLFAYGDVDGKLYVAKLQHPLGVAYHPLEQAVYVADTYNHRIKRIELATNECTTCVFNSGSADDSSEYTFQEPGGLCVSGDGELLFVADTNNHRVMRVNLRTGRSETWRLNFEAATATSEVTDGTTTATVATAATNGRGASTAPIIRADRELRLGAAGSFTSLQLSVEFLADGRQLKLTPDAPQRVVALVSDASAVGVQTFADNFCANNPTVLLALTPTGASDAGGSQETDGDGANNKVMMTLQFRLNLCAGSMCFPRALSLEIPLVCGLAAEFVHDVESWRVLVRDDGAELVYG